MPHQPNLQIQTVPHHPLDHYSRQKLSNDKNAALEFDIKFEKSFITHLSNISSPLLQIMRNWLYIRNLFLILSNTSF